MSVLGRVRPEQATIIRLPYVACMRVRVRAGNRRIVREGNGFGHAFASSSADAHERAPKAAETDAIKRALVTFSNRFGLSFYNKYLGGMAHAPYSHTLTTSHLRGRVDCH